MMTEAITLPTRAATAITPSERHGSACSSREPGRHLTGSLPRGTRRTRYVGRESRGGEHLGSKPRTCRGIPEPEAPGS